MLPTWVVVASSGAYLAFLFGVAAWAERRTAAGRNPTANAWVYSLSLSVFATSWTFYGSVGRAETGGVGFLPVYLGPTLVLAGGWVALRRAVRAARRERVATVGDFLASRYGHSALLGALVAVVALVGLVPYVALQFRAIATSFAVLVPGADTGTTAAVAAAGLGAFALLFGTRRVLGDRLPGLVAAVAVEGVVKLVAFLAAGVFTTFVLFDGPADIFGAHELRTTPAALPPTTLPPAGQLDFLALTVLSGLAFLCLPRQFHVMVVENVDDDHLRRASWLFPLYLLLINLFVLPLAWAGAHTFGQEVSADAWVLALPGRAGQTGLALFVFLGGFSAAAGMIVVETVALSALVGNGIASPLLVRAGIVRRQGTRTILLWVRRAATAAIVTAGWGWTRMLEGKPLVDIGLVSFAAVAQLAPGLLGGMVWRGGTALGVGAGIVAGMAVWTWTLVVPVLARAGYFPETLLAEGPWGIAALRPEGLGGLGGVQPLTLSVFWSLLANVGIFVGVSILRAIDPVARVQAARFLDAVPLAPASPRAWSTRATVGDVQALLARVLGPGPARAALVEAGAPEGSAPVYPSLVRQAETRLAAAVGGPSARVLVASLVGAEEMEAAEVRALVDEASRALVTARQLEERTRQLEAATQALSVNEARLQALLDHIPAVVTLKDREGRFVLVNRRFEELTGRTLAEVRGHAVGQVHTGETARAVFERERLVLAREAVAEGETHYAGPAGDRTFLCTSFPVRDEGGRLTGVGTVGIDITARKRTEEALRSAQARFHGILDLAADAVVSMDPGLRIVLFNRAAEGVFGWSADEVLGRPVDVLLTPRTRARMRGLLARLAVGLEGSVRIGVRRPVWCARREGAEFPATIALSRLSLGEEVVLTAFVTDRTQQWEQQRAIATLNRELSARAAELEVSNRELEAFAYSVSHDLRAPLRGIDGFTRLVLEEESERLDDRGRAWLLRVRNAAGRMAQLIDDLLLLSQISRQPMAIKPVDLSEVAASVVDELRAREPGRDVDVDIQPGLVAQADPSLLRVVMENLLGNAWKYTSRRERAHVRVGSWIRDDGARVYFVEDDGAGFDMRYAGRLFTAFSRLHATEEFPGTGIGLVVVQRVVERHGGAVWGEGEVDRGARFSFHLGERDTAGFAGSGPVSAPP